MAKATLTWNANTETDLGGYKIYRGLGSATPSLMATVGKVTTYEDQSIPDVSQVVTYQLTAYDMKGNESQKSPPVSITIDVTAPDTPTGFTVTVIVTVTPP